MKEIRKLLALNLALLLLLCQLPFALAAERGENDHSPERDITLQTDREVQCRGRDKMTFTPGSDGFYHFILTGNSISCGDLRLYEDGEELPQVYGEDVYDFEQARSDGLYAGYVMSFSTNYLEKGTAYGVTIETKRVLVDRDMIHTLLVKKAPSDADLTTERPKVETPKATVVPMRLGEGVDFDSGFYSFTPQEDGRYRFRVEELVAASCPFLVLYQGEEKLTPAEEQGMEFDAGPRISDYELAGGTTYRTGYSWPWFGVDLDADSRLTVTRIDAQGNEVPEENETRPDVAQVFSDVAADSWYREAVQYVYDEGMMQGVQEDRFDPGEPSTRGTLLTMLYRMEGEPGVFGRSFSDVPGGAWYENAVIWASANGIATGYEDGSFRPEAVITREQLATILYRYATQKGYDVTGRAELSQFSDAGNISAYAETAMSWAKSAGIITGSDWGGVSPTNTATRAEVAAMLMRFCENVVE